MEKRWGKGLGRRKKCKAKSEPLSGKERLRMTDAIFTIAACVPLARVSGVNVLEMAW
jgi:hypothetical protein